MEPPRLTVFSTPLISTWILDETHRILFDAGDGVTALLEGKIHKANIIALTHAHRDHIGGLLQLLNLRGGVAAMNGEPLRIFHPDGSGSFQAIGRFLSHFDQSTSGRTQWQSLRPGDKVELSDKRFLRAYATRHVPSPDPTKFRTLGYQIGRVVDRLKPELRSLSQSELDRLRLELGRDAIIQQEEEILLAISGDTTALSPQSLCGAQYLLHECTFLDNESDRISEARERGHEHACLSDVIDLAAEANVRHLALYHISKRYTDEEILRAVRTECDRRDLRCKVSVALPGRVYIDLFSQTIWPDKNR